MSTCLQLKQAYQALKKKKEEFIVALDKAIQTKTPADLKTAKELKKQLEIIREEIKETLWPFEALPIKELERQYNYQKETLQELGLLEKLSTGELGIKIELAVGSPTEEYPFPTLKEIKERIKNKKEFFKTKTEQGLTKLIISPLADIEKLKEAYGKLIKEKKAKGELKGVDGQDLDLDESNPVFMWEEYKNLRYFPEWENNEPKEGTGMTKKELVKKLNGFNIILTEDIPKAPEEGQGKPTKSKNDEERKPPEGGQTTQQQYEQIKQLQEQGFIPEDWFTYAILYLKERDTVLDDDQGTNYYCRLIGAGFEGEGFSGCVPVVYWFRDGRRADLGGVDSVDSNSPVVVRVVVGV